ncbi:Helix-turn-helix domain [Prauserella sp. Am3]|nr:Helix-turn-helix domain [Prauserella sp. Am3]
MDNVIGDALRRARSAQGMSLRQLARAVHFSPGYLSKVENGVKIPSVELAVACDRVLGISPTIADLAKQLPRKRRPIAHPDAVVPAQLPHAPAGFFGREAELAALAEWAHAGLHVPELRCRLLTGDSETGKTALAVYFGHMNAAGFPDGQLYLDLRGSTSNPLATSAAHVRLLRGIGVGAGSIPEDPDELLATYRSLLAGRRLLMVLDDAADAEQLRPLLPGGGACTVLATSRHRMPDLVVRDGATETRIGAVTDTATREVLRAGLGTARIAAEPAATSALVAALDGRPLAIRTAVARLQDEPSLTVTAYLAALLADRAAEPPVLRDPVHRPAEFHRAQTLTG